MDAPPGPGHQPLTGSIGGAGAELVEEVDRSGNVQRTVTRAEMRAQNLRHRSVYIVVRSGDGESILAHQRAPFKDVWPSWWDLAFGGVCAVGEPWRSAAARELAEEAGVEADPEALVDHGEDSFESAEVRVRGRLFSVLWDGPFTFTDGEVVDSRWVAVHRLHEWVAGHDGKVCPDTLRMLALLT